MKASKSAPKVPWDSPYPPTRGYAPTHIPYRHLHPVFSHGIKQLKHLKPEFLAALKQACRKLSR